MIFPSLTILIIFLFTVKRLCVESGAAAVIFAARTPFQRSQRAMREAG